MTSVPKRAYTHHVSMPWYLHLLYFLLSILTAGLALPLWWQAERKWRKEHTVTEYR